MYWNGLQEEANEYEQERAERIARNRAKLMELNLPHLAAQIAPKAKAPTNAPRGLKARRKEVHAG